MISLVASSEQQHRRFRGKGVKAWRKFSLRWIQRFSSFFSGWRRRWIYRFTIASLKPNLTLNINQLKGTGRRLLEILSKFLLFSFVYDIKSNGNCRIFILSYFEYRFEENSIAMEIETLVGMVTTRFLWKLRKGKRV